MDVEKRHGIRRIFFKNIEILSKICQETRMMNGWMLKRDTRIGIKNLKTLKYYEKSSKKQA
jgi:hypothetical protein